MVEIKKFYNKPNGRIRINHHDGEKTFELDYWIHRAVAVVGVVFLIPLVGHTSILITKRSKKMRDEPGKYGVPCGYIDWNETGYEGMLREVYEETNLYLPDYDKYLIFNNNEKPFDIKDNPQTSKHQNISLIYLSVYDFTGGMNDYPHHILNYKNNESAEVKLLTISDFMKTSNDIEWAFHHDKTICDAIEFYGKAQLYNI